MTSRDFVLEFLRIAVPIVAVSGLTISAQTYQPTQDPVVTAQNEPWYIEGQPVAYSGSLYYPTGPQVFFNRHEMVRGGTYRGIPIYVRPMIEPFGKIYLPLAGGLMQPYERRREGSLAGTVGSSVPSFPGQIASEQYRQADVPASAGAASDQVFIIPVDTQPATPPEPIGTAGTADVVVISPPEGPLASARRPQGLNGIFIEFDGRRWFSSGRSVEFEAERFTPVGDYRGFAVYADRHAPDGTRYVAVTNDKSARLAPYATRE